ncbi:MULTISPECIES: hypothetical protein [unclassified Pseudomonas]|uniref:hypothetical protein n=1 Tax=unclassified Pseudomonas TaxID=196821 RepID=UPI0030D9D7A9
MSEDYGQASLAALNLTGATRAQADKLLQTILSSATTPATLRAIDRAEGFILGLETVGALSADAIERLYLAFYDAAQTRLTELT